MDNECENCEYYQKKSCKYKEGKHKCFLFELNSIIKPIGEILNASINYELVTWDLPEKGELIIKLRKNKKN